MTNITMEDLRSFWKECLGCKLGSTRKNMVFGEGAVPARIFFIGEGPGAQEDEQGRPFVGKAGQLLDRMIEAMGLTRDQIYIGNIVKCRPPGNRDPETDEMLSCMPVLERQIELVRPEVIVSLGRISAQVLLSTTRSLSKLRGSWHTYGTIPLLATYHPAYLLRNPAAKKAAWEDLQMVMKQLNLAGNT
ncbi:uracil-DNA glycosylase [Myxococcota bacterium]|nr:uracil-DNA glycosylase [Myxococcota bacterium]MBU1535105.1 uracil-DNA glycosylase [Myxococcota bacterium]